ncbi:SoxR reducing system RseC family protein [Desulfobacterales bacterium HSG2]|nr:SoxR reducing system RseC family protein [Desulfobacterales bacterium HSG2]
MATETGIVTKLGSTTAWVKTTKTSACESCAAKDGCHTLGGGKEMEVEAINTAKAKVGDRVVIGFKDASLIKASFLIYIFPILSMIAGAVIGEKIAEVYGFTASALSVTGGFLFFLLAFLIVKSVGTKLSAKNEYRPKIIRIKRHGIRKDIRGGELIEDYPEDASI